MGTGNSISALFYLKLLVSSHHLTVIIILLYWDIQFSDFLLLKLLNYSEQRKLLRYRVAHLKIETNFKNIYSF